MSVGRVFEFREEAGNSLDRNFHGTFSAFSFLSLPFSKLYSESLFSVCSLIRRRLEKNGNGDEQSASTMVLFRSSARQKTDLGKPGFSGQKLGLGFIKLVHPVSPRFFQLLTCGQKKKLAKSGRKTVEKAGKFWHVCIQVPPCRGNNAL
jgi:hypothetical protein